MGKAISILLYGYGNPGRQDDGLGYQFIENINQWIAENHLNFIKTDTNYQLNIEDVVSISQSDVVFFIDASMEEDIEEYKLTELSPQEDPGFSTHSVSPVFLISLCHKLFEKFPKTYMVHIKGYEWEFKEGLTINAARNLKKALDYIKESIHKIQDKTFF